MYQYTEIRRAGTSVEFQQRTDVRPANNCSAGTWYLPTCSSNGCIGIDLSANTGVVAFLFLVNPQIHSSLLFSFPFHLLCILKRTCTVHGKTNNLGSVWQVAYQQQGSSPRAFLKSRPTTRIIVCLSSYDSLLFLAIYLIYSSL